MGVVYFLLISLFTFIVATVAAFTYLPWWQAILVSAATLAGLVMFGRFLVFWQLRRATTLLKLALDVRGRLLRGATLDVHSVRPAATGSALRLPALGVSDASVHIVEMTVFPTDELSSEAWHPAELRLAPVGAPEPNLLGGGAGELVPFEVELIENGEAMPAGPVRGARRVRLTVEVPRGVTRLAVRYGLHQFGQVDLSHSRLTE